MRMKRLAFAASVLLVTACGGTSHDTATTVTVTQTVTVQAAVPGRADHTPPPAAGVKSVIDPLGRYVSVIDNDGIYLIGPDIQPGIYRTDGGPECYWARLHNHDIRDVIDSKRIDMSQLIEIKESDTAFLTRNCGLWQMIPRL
jgi:hypothetical protein